MVRYHVRDNGYVGRCVAAPGNCAVRKEGGGEVAHFSDRESALAATEKKMAKTHDITASTSKKASGARKAKAAPAFEVPPAKSVEGYLGAAGYVGGNLLRLQEEKGSGVAYSTKEITAEMRKDIKSAVKSGYLPSNINGAKVSYYVRTDSGGNAINVTAKVNESPLDYRPMITSGYRNSQQISFQSRSAEKLESVRGKLDAIHKSYNYNRSNSMVDYFDTNFYGKSKIESTGGFESAHKSQKKAVKSVVDEYVSGNQEIDPGKSYTFDEKVAFIDKAAQENPKVKQALVDWADATNEYTLANNAENQAYNESSEITQREHRDMSYQGDSDREGLLLKMESVSIANQISYRGLADKNNKTESLEDLNFYNNDKSEWRGGNSGLYHKKQLVNEIFNSMENRGVRYKSKPARNSIFWR